MGGHPSRPQTTFKVLPIPLVFAIEISTPESLSLSVPPYFRTNSYSSFFDKNWGVIVKLGDWFLPSSLRFRM